MEFAQISPSMISTAYEGMDRPECILCTRESGMFVSHRPTGVVHLKPDGTRRVLGQGKNGFTPNGIALRDDGSLLMANMGAEGGVWEITPRGDMRPFLMEVEGRELSAANYVAVDHEQRVWISISTQTKPRTLAYNQQVRDGFVVMADQQGARIVAEGFGFTNECRLAPDGKALYVVETFGRRISRVPLGQGTIGSPDVFCELSAGAFPDGAAFDSENHLWVTSIISNRLYRIDPQGHARIVLEDHDASTVNAIERSYQEGRLSLEQLGLNTGKFVLPISSLAFGGKDLKTVYLGTTHGNVIKAFRSPVAGHPLSHWAHRTRPTIRS